MISTAKFFLDHKNLYIMGLKVLNKFSHAKNYKPVKFNDKKIFNIRNYIKTIDHQLYLETLEYEKILNKIAYDKLFNIKFDIGYRFSKTKGEIIGGGAYDLIYFLSKKFKPKTIIETGVGAGFATHSILSAIEKNNFGSLFSSDFPYFKVSDPLKYIGMLLDENQKKFFNIKTKGDRFNIPQFIKSIKHIDFIHYDSDKSYSGKKWFFNFIKPYISPKTIIVIDDIQDDSFFLDYINENKIVNFKIFKCDNKYVGLINNNI